MRRAAVSTIDTRFGQYAKILTPRSPGPGRAERGGVIDAFTPAPSLSPPSGATVDGSPGAQASGRLRGNPLFRDGVDVHEFQVDARNIDFAQKQFALEPAFVDLVKGGKSNASLSVIYHSDDTGVNVDAYRAVAPTVTGKRQWVRWKGATSDTGVFSIYKIKNPNFDPTNAYSSELFTRIAPDTVFGTVEASPHLIVPEQADASLKGWLDDNGFAKTKTVALGDINQDTAFKSYFGLNDQMPIDVYDPKNNSFADRFKIYYELLKASPQYRAEQAGMQLANIGSSALLGVITPVLWSEGTLYGIAATMASLDNIANPTIGILGGSVFGGVVDTAVNSDHPMENLKKIGLGVAVANTVSTGAVLCMHPTLLKLISSAHPAIAAVGLYATQDVVAALSGDASARSTLAIEDQLINKNPPPGEDYSKNFFQIQGVETALGRALSVGTYAATVAAATAFPQVAFPLALAGAALSIGSNFIFPLYNDKPEVKVTIEGTGYVSVGDRCVFDSGWEVGVKGGDGRIVKEDAHHFSISLNDGALDIKNDNAPPLQMTHKRRLIDYLPKILKPRILGEHEQWDLSNGSGGVVISRYGNGGYRVGNVSDHEVTLSR